MGDNLDSDLIDYNLKCYLIHKPSSETTPIKKIINAYNYRISDSYSLPIIGGQNILNNIRKEIKQNDLIVAIISENDPNILVELGIAMGLGKPIFLILSNDNVQIPLEFLTYTRFDLNNTDSFKSIFELFLKSVVTKIKKKKLKNQQHREKIKKEEVVKTKVEVNLGIFTIRNTIKNHKPKSIQSYINDLNDKSYNVRLNAIKALGEFNDKRIIEPLISALKDENAKVRKNAAITLGKSGDEKAIEPLLSAIPDEDWHVNTAIINELKNYSESLNRRDIENINRIRNTGNWSEIEAIISQILMVRGIIFEKTNEIEKGFQPDYSIWLDSLDSIFGNPIIIEVKTGNLNERLLLNTEKQIFKYLTMTNAKSGILIYLDKDNRRFPIETLVHPNIIRLELSDLINELNNKSLEEIVFYTRSQNIHILEG